MLKMKLISVVSVVSILFGSVYAYAEIKILKQYTSTTYAKYDHIDNSLDDESRSDVSIRGIDRIRDGTTTEYPQRIWITYNVQGDVTVVSQSSTSRYDEIQRRNRMIVYDRWNFGGVTKAVWNSNLIPVEGEIITPTGNVQ